MRACAALLYAVAVAAFAAACGGGDDESARQPATFRNPVYAADFPDPFVLRVGDTYYAYGTNGHGDNVQTLRSNDLVQWQRGEDALPKVGRWAYSGKTWAPEVLDVGDGTFVLYYTANGANFGVQCVGRAVARSPEGPFVDERKRPLVCQKRLGGSIDPSPFRDEDGRLYLLWKNDGNCCGLDTYIYARRLSRNGLRLVGPRAELVHQDVAWEGNVVEAPTMWRQGLGYYLFFSGNAFDSDAYAVGYARCDGPLGPCRDAPENPILASACEASGPGHQALVRVEGKTWIVYHAWPAHPTGPADDARMLWIDRLDWKDGRPAVEGPTCRRQPVP